MTATTDGGPAFPSQWDDKDHDGMSLRDWFAGQALMGIIAHPRNADAEGGRFFARQAYQLADAMLAERSKIGGAA